MKRVAFDIETHLIKPGMLFPKLVCISFYDGTQRELYLASLGLRRLIQLLKDPDVVLVGHNVAFDLGVVVAEAIDQGYDPDEILSLVFSAYDQDRIADTMIRTMLVDISEGTFQEIEGQRRGKMYGLDVLAQRWLRKFMQKKDSWRLHYASLENVPLAEWDFEAREYAELDSENTWKIDQAISAWAITEGVEAPGNIPDEFRQHRAAWVLHLMAGWGVRIDSEMVAGIRLQLEAQRTKAYAIMDQYGLFKKSRSGEYKLTKKGQRSINQKQLKAYIQEGFESRGETPPTTAGRVDKKTGVRVPDIKCGADEARESGHIGCVAYADVANAIKLLSTYIPALERGDKHCVTSSPNVLVASGRTSWTSPNWQNPPRLGNIRECVIPRGFEYEEIEVPDDYVLRSGESWI